MLIMDGGFYYDLDFSVKRYEHPKLNPNAMNGRVIFFGKF